MLPQSPGEYCSSTVQPSNTHYDCSLKHIFFKEKKDVRPCALEGRRSDRHINVYIFFLESAFVTRNMYIRTKTRSGDSAAGRDNGACPCGGGVVHPAAPGDPGWAVGEEAEVLAEAARGGAD